MTHACCVEPDLSHQYIPFCFQGYKEPDSPVLVGFTPKGGVAVLINAMQAVGICIQQAQKELCNKSPSLWLVNGNMFSAASCLKGILDGLANYCQQQVPLEEFVGFEVHFADYRFQVSEFAALQQHKHMLEALSYGGKSFHAACNEIKHNGPWVGQTSRNGGRQDLYEECGFVHEFMVPAYKHTISILSKLAARAKLQDYTFPQV
jgi:hypothetical protein